MPRNEGGGGAAVLEGREVVAANGPTATDDGGRSGRRGGEASQAASPTVTAAPAGPASPTGTAAASGAAAAGRGGETRQSAPRLRLLARPPLRIADVTLFYGERSGGIRTYLDAKAAYADATGAFEHHLIVPGPGVRRTAGPASTRHELASVAAARSNGYRLPLGSADLKARLAELRPDVVLLHDPFWAPREVTRHAQQLGAVVVMVHHGSAALDAGAWPGPDRVYRAGFRAWMRRAYTHADGVMAACDPFDDTLRVANIELRFGLDPAFRPRLDIPRGHHVLYAGRLAREKGVFALLEAAARSRTPWPLRIVGTGSAADAVRIRAHRLGLDQRIQWRPFISDREALAREYASASCVVMPGELETFGLVAFEAAACAAPVIACSTAPAANALGPLVHTFEAGDRVDLLDAIESARRERPDKMRALAFAERHSWKRAFESELADLEELVGW